jgi:predicted DNA-binding transcriptional regulator YafY
MNRLDRLTSILIQLQSKRVVTAQEIAERFSISLRTVYRDIRTLEEGGIPLSGEAGIGYSIMDGYRLPPVMFTKEEATAFLTAEKLIEKLADESTDESYKSAMYKVKAVLRASEKDYLETLDKHIKVIDSPYVPTEKLQSGRIPLILKSITEKSILSIDYFANHSQEKTKRDIEPVGIFYMSNYWHLVAYCHLRKDYRDFRIDRINHIAQTNHFFEKEHPSLNSFIQKITKDDLIHRIVMRIDKKIMKHFGDQKYYNGFVSQKELKNGIEMTFLAPSIEGFARWYMMFGDNAEIVSPPELKARIKQIAAIISKKVK